MIFLVSLAFLLLGLMVSAQDTECGTTRSVERIVGGEKVGGSKYPWFAMLRAKLEGDPPVCAGALITESHVLTAAHCFGLPMFAETPYKDHFNVAFGVYDWCVEDEEYRETVSVSKVTLHENWVFGGDYYDIAVMELSTAVTDIPTVCLPDSRKPTKSEPARIAGWGYLVQDGNDTPCQQREADITRFTQEECAETNLPSRDVEEPSVFCAGGDGIDTCQGDSGGPLLTYNEKGNFVISGIVSFGYGCAQPSLPGVYTDVGSYLEWIADKIGGTIEEVDNRMIMEPMKRSSNHESSANLKNRTGLVRKWK